MRNTLRLKGNVLVPVLIVLLLCVLIFVLSFPSLKEWWHARGDTGGTADNPTIPAELVGPNTLQLTSEVVKALNMGSVPVQKVEEGQVLELTGSLAPDTDHLLPLRSRFAGEVVEIGEVHQGDPESIVSYRSVTTGDKVKKGQLLTVVWCKDLGEKKSELVDAISHLTLDLDTLTNLEKASRESGAIPEQSLREARRNVAADRIAITRAELTLAPGG